MINGIPTTIVLPLLSTNRRNVCLCVHFHFHSPGSIRKTRKQTHREETLDLIFESNKSQTSLSWKLLFALWRSVDCWATSIASCTHTHTYSLTQTYSHTHKIEAAAVTQQDKKVYCAMHGLLFKRNTKHNASPSTTTTTMRKNSKPK